MFRLLKLKKKILKESREIEKVNLKPEIFANERQMRDFFAENDNLNKIFPSLHFLVKEYQVRKNSFFDTVAFNPNNKSFVIIEYKLENENDKLKQILKYKKYLDDNQKSELLEETVNGYYLKNKERASTDISKYNWKLKIVLVSSQYEGKELKEIASLVKIGCVKIKEEKYLYAETDDKELLELDIGRKKEGVVEKPNQILKIDTKKRIKELSGYLKKSYSSLHEKAMNVFGSGYITYIYYYNKKLLFSLVSKKESIKILLNLQELAEKDKKILESEFELKGNKGNYRKEFDSEYIIGDEKSFKKVFDLLNIYLEKKLDLI